MRVLAALFAPFAIALAPGIALAEGRALSVEDVVQMALSNGPRLASSRARATAQEFQKKSVGGHLLPTVVVSDEYQHYTSPFDIAFAVGPGPAPSIRARDQDTNTFIAGVSQPLGGLPRRLEDYKAQGLTAEAAQAGVKVAEASTREGIEAEYLRMFEAKALAEVAQASQHELGEEVTVTEAKVKAGTLTTADLLRVQVAEANARQQEIAARTQSTVSRATILGTIGLPPDDASIEFLEPTALLPSPEQAHNLVTGAAAIARRPEIAQARLEADAAHHQERSKLYALLPEVDLEAAYARLDGQVFAAKNSAFVGVKAQWPIWEWGATWNAHRAAEAQESAARSEVEAQRRQVLVEVTVRRAQLDSAVSAVQLAQQTIVSAQEAYRVTEALVRAGASTVTDLLDAQSALTQARLNLTRARYEQAIARVQLDRSTGGR